MEQMSRRLGRARIRCEEGWERPIADPRALDAESPGDGGLTGVPSTWSAWPPSPQRVPGQS